jgi:hypothetical protein
MTLIAAKESFSSRDFQHWFIEHHVPVVLRSMPQLQRYEVTLVDVPCSRGNHAQVQGRRNPAYDIVVEAWIHDALDPDVIVNPTDDEKIKVLADLGSRASAIHAYRVEGSVELDRQAGGTGRLPGVRSISLVYFLAHLTATEIVQHWDAHVGPTLLTLRGMTEYTRNYVREALSADAPVVPAFGSLTFETLHDWENIPYQPDTDDFLSVKDIVIMDGTRHRLL